MTDPIEVAAAEQPGSPYRDGDSWVYPDGRRLARVAGGEIATPPAAEAGAGEGGAGGEAQDGGSLDELYDLSSVPEELRSVVEPIIRQVQGNVTKRFQEHADLRKQWEPLSQVEGLTDVPAEELSELLGFREIAADPEQFDEWLAGIALAIHKETPERFEAIFERLGTESGLFGDEGDGEGEGDGESDVLDQMRQLLDERLGPVEEKLNGQDAEGRVEAAKQKLTTDLEQIGAKHKETYGDDAEVDEDTVKQLAFAYGGADDAIEKAYGDWLRVTGKAEGDLVDEKLGQPKSGPAGGAPDTQPEEFDGPNDPRIKQTALARMRAGA